MTPVAVLDRDRDECVDPCKHGTDLYLPPCSACGATMQADKAVFIYQDAVFCEDCWHDLPVSERDEVARAIALRGVPLS